MLYAQPVTKIAKLRRSEVVQKDGETFVRLGGELLPIAETLGQLLRELSWRLQVVKMLSYSNPTELRRRATTLPG